MANSTIYNKLIDEISIEDSSFCKMLKIIKSEKKGNFFIAGGAVRNTYLNKSIKDVDIFVNEAAFKILYSFISKNGLLVNNPFGSYRWFSSEEKKFYYDIIIIQRFYNGLWRCNDIIDVLNQFDITCNSIAFDLKSGQLFNPQNGVKHIKDRLLRAVRFDFPEIDLSDDIKLSRNSILWFRINHYSKLLNFELDDITLKWVKENEYRIRDLKLFKKIFFQPFIV